MTLTWLALLASACADEPERSVGPLPPSSAAERAVVVDPALVDALAGATAADAFEVIVNFDETMTTSEALTSSALALGAGVIRFRHLSMVAALATPAQLAAIEGLPGVQSVYLNRQLQYLLAEGVESIKADQVHAQGITGKGVGIAILDSGIDGFHSDVVYPDRTVQNVKFVAASQDLFTFGDGLPNVGAELFVENVPNSETSVGHGTHVAGIAAGDGTASGGKYTGVAPGADLVGIGAGDILFIFWILAGFDYVLDNREAHNIQVVNNSWGSTGPFDPDDPINEATRTVHDAGITVVFSAGNCGTGGSVDCPPEGENQLNPYSVAPWVIGVAAGCKLVPDDPTISAVHCEDPTGQGREPVLADFSSRGIPGDPLNHPDVTAPGVHVVSARASTGPVLTVLDAPHDFDLTSTCAIATEHVLAYTCASGTSMSAPHVTGLVALMGEVAGGGLRPDDVLAILVATARPLDGYDPFEVGAGYVDAVAAVKQAQRGKFRR